MRPLISADLWRWIEENRASFEPPVGNKVIWEDSQFTAMVIRGPNRRRDFHDDPSDEIFYMLRGAMTLEYIDEGGRRRTPSSARVSCSSSPPTRSTRPIAPPTPGGS